MSTGRLAIIAGGGDLPGILAEAEPKALQVVFRGVDTHLAAPDHTVSFERLGGLFETLRNQHVSRVVFAGAMARPALDPKKFDSKMVGLAPRLMSAMQGGDDGILRLVVRVFEEEGFTVLGAHELVPELIANPGLLAGPEPDSAARADILRANDILSALAPVDVGQGVVVAGGLCLGIETLQGTRAMLEFVAATPANLRRNTGGVLVKLPKSGQEQRLDLPSVGPETIAQMANAGLTGLVIAAGQVLLLQRDELLQAADSADIFVLAQAL